MSYEDDNVSFKYISILPFKYRWFKFDVGKIKILSKNEIKCVWVKLNFNDIEKKFSLKETHYYYYYLIRTCLSTFKQDTFNGRQWIKITKIM